MMHPLCLIRTIWRSLRCFAPVSGHDYATDDEPTPDNVHVLRCMTCGHVNTAWSWSTMKHAK